MHLVGAVFALLAWTEPGPSSASPMPGAQARNVTELPCYGGLGDFDVRVHPDRITTVYATSPLLAAEYPPERGFDVRKNTSEKRITIFPLGSARPDASINVRVITETCEASITLQIADKAADALRMARIVARPEAEASSPDGAPETSLDRDVGIEGPASVAQSG